VPAVDTASATSPADRVVTNLPRRVGEAAMESGGAGSIGASVSATGGAPLSAGIATPALSPAALSRAPPAPRR
jgi:hypothetical protein